MALRREHFWRSRLINGLQTLLILAGLALVLSVPSYLLAGGGGVLLCLLAVLMAVYISGFMPARLILTDAGAGPLQRPQAPELYRILDILYQRAGLTTSPQLYYAPSRDLNAFAVGSHRDGGIAITDGLLRTLLQLALSRNREYTADLEAVALTGDPHALASALQLLERFHGSWLTTMFGRHEPAWIDWLRTHPPTEERIRRLLAIGGRPWADLAQPILRQPDLERPVILQRPGPMGGRYWILRRR